MLSCWGGGADFAFWLFVSLAQPVMQGWGENAQPGPEVHFIWLFISFNSLVY